MKKLQSHDHISGQDAELKPGNAQADQEEFFLETLPLIRNIIYKRLRGGYLNSVEDIIQRVSLKLWHWRTKHKDISLDGGDWKRLANTAAQNEVKTFYGEKSRSEVQFSTENGFGSGDFLQDKSAFSKIEGNSEAESLSLIRSLWDAMQGLSLRHRYVLLFYDKSFIVDLVVANCCTIDELAAFLEIPAGDFRKLITELPLSDQKLSELLKREFGIEATKKQLWNARGKAKAKLYKAVKNSI